MALDKITEMLGDEAKDLLEYKARGFPAGRLHLPGPDFIDRVASLSDRSPTVLRNLAAILNHGRLAGTGYVSILPVDQGIEHSAGASFAPNPDYFDPENIVRLAIEGGCNAVASTLGVLGSVARRYAHRIPFLVKLNHNELLTYPNTYDQIFFAEVDQAFDMGAVAVGATIYFGSEESDRQIQEVSAGLRPRPRAGPGDRAVVLPAQRRVQDGRGGLPVGRRPDRPGQPSRRDDPGGHHQAEAAGVQRRLHGPEVRQDLGEGLQRADAGRPSHRADALPGGQLLHGPQRADQLRRGVRQGRLPARRSARPSSTSAPAAWG